MNEHRRPAPRNTRVRDLPPGTGLSVRQFRPYWDVVARRKQDGKGTEHVVTDSSVEGKPVVVWGPGTLEDATVWARTTANLWAAVKGQTDD